MRLGTRDRPLSQYDKAIAYPSHKLGSGSILSGSGGGIAGARGRTSRAINKNYEPLRLGPGLYLTIFSRPVENGVCVSWALGSALTWSPRLTSAPDGANHRAKTGKIQIPLKHFLGFYARGVVGRDPGLCT